MALYPNAVKELIPPGVNDPRITAVGVILHTDAGNVGDLHDYFNGPSGGIESHFHIPKKGQCLAPHHRVLTADLRWVPLGDVQVGDKLVGFTENAIGGERRRYETSTVEWVESAVDEVYAVVLSDERVFYTTADHRWLSRNDTEGDNRVYTGWRQTSPTGTSRTIKGANVVDLLPVWDDAEDFESGWMAGILDGEGSLNEHHRITVSQRPTVVLDKMQHYLKENGVEYNTRLVHDDADCVAVQVNGGLRGNLALLGRLRPARLLAKVNPDSFGEIRGTGVKVVAVYPVGQREIIRMQTSTRTFIADGIGMHNCQQYRDTAYEADANFHGNSFVINGERLGFISVETQGLASDPWNDHQLAEIKKLILWAKSVHPRILLRVCPEWNKPGIGYHTLFGSPGPWTPVAKSCPGPKRIKQFNDVLVPWFKTATNPPPKPPTDTPPKDDDMSAADVELGIRNYLHDFYGPTGTGGVYHQQEVDHRAAVLEAMKDQTDAIKALAAAIAAKV